MRLITYQVVVGGGGDRHAGEVDHAAVAPGHVGLGQVQGGQEKHANGGKDGKHLSPCGAWLVGCCCCCWLVAWSTCVFMDVCIYL